MSFVWVSVRVLGIVQFSSRDATVDCVSSQTSTNGLRGLGWIELGGHRVQAPNRFLNDLRLLVR